MNNIKQRERVLLWIDIKTSKKDDKAADGADGTDKAPE